MHFETVSPCIVIVPLANFCDHFPRTSPRWLDIYLHCPLWRYLHMHNNNATSAQEQRVAGHPSSSHAWPAAKAHVVCLETFVSPDRPAGTLTPATCTSTDVQTSPTKMRLVHTSAGPTVVSITRSTLNQHPLTTLSLVPVDGS